MKKGKICLQYFLLLTALLNSGILSSQSRGLKLISEAEMKYHLEFIAAPEFRGRQTPSCW